jgi:hypothetical protein
MPVRQCGDCQLCCKLVPVHEKEPWPGRKPVDKKAGQRCEHQRHHKGCVIYDNRPMCCGLWYCRWLVNDDADELSRPDRSHYVIDVMPDFIILKDNATGAEQHVQVVQIWIDPSYPEAHRDPALRRWLLRRAQEGIAALIRFNERDAITVFAPPFDANGQWHEIVGGQPGPGHSATEIAHALGGRVAVRLAENES